jgi:hypothetical protein
MHGVHCAAPMVDTLVSHPFAVHVRHM